MSLPTEKELLAAACHIGHPKNKWHPKMASYLYAVRKGIHIFDLTQTCAHLARCVEELKKLQAEGKTILFVSTKQQSIPLIEEIGESLKQPTVTKKWIPGLLTNWSTLKRRIKYYLELKESFRNGEVEKYTKKEQVQLRKKLTKLDTALGGVSGMVKIPDAVFVIDALRDRVAVLEANVLKIPVFGICDSNVDPSLFRTLIPANDDAVKSIGIILATIRDSLGGSNKEHSPELREDNRESVIGIKS
ncbi:MAG: small subunit ribosomal protein S2 [Candidatus Peribacter riflensis]|uniref:Small ribosomal subunit protein uS2 n=1 Tax=Candidatus Peribacter riflensis TaxID=1735162 RepID=A0A0S1SH02_9BACT|nr:MAG: small subunit ribosomal protein S2 [Candidatus Peribacter riflensis]OGJ78247.1 MAG: 30S ribosomal protein S2 [Candidatus Peribacteria bacterium RIFOXYB1_FULL_57_12]OGJ80659.1 MAG: 30S ribosomal protein S2 [Candidatus Peribacteria bacterium RIFOXYC1_FULL_58_8]ALM10772.1 MAG: small subunit ribosomal protein S2 [Candidatus Peribacter riflensis]ALM11874.1 MAG: small subunit ribosomal protein S2 [Candidatus Peribacter riflensis]